MNGNKVGTVSTSFRLPGDLPESLLQCPTFLLEPEGSLFPAMTASRLERSPHGDFPGDPQLWHVLWTR